MMRVPNPPICALAAFAALVASPALGGDGQLLGTMPHGVYQCSLPGDAAGPAWRPIEGGRFTIGNASSYSTRLGKGTYLLSGKEFVFTRGPWKGARYRRTGSWRLQLIEPDGKLGRVVCARIKAEA